MELSLIDLLVEYFEPRTIEGTFIRDAGGMDGMIQIADSVIADYEVFPYLRGFPSDPGDENYFRVNVHWKTGNVEGYQHGLNGSCDFDVRDPDCFERLERFLNLEPDANREPKNG